MHTFKAILQFKDVKGKMVMVFYRQIAKYPDGKGRGTMKFTESAT